MIAEQQLDTRKIARTSSRPLRGLGARLCRFGDLPVGIGVAFVVRGQSLAVFRMRDGSVRAIQNSCPHKGGPLADGMVVNAHVVCPLHAYRYRLCDGASDVAGRCGVTAYETHVMEGWVWVDVPL